MQIALRPYEGTDFNIVTSIWLDAWKSTDIGATQTGTTLSYLRERFPLELARGWVAHVATTSESVVGFLAIYQCKLEQLFVTPRMQSKGIGKQLPGYAKELEPGGFWLHTAVENVRSCRFYEREGLVRGEVSIHNRLGHQIVRYDWRQL